jgi:hypothetical protein
VVAVPKVEDGRIHRPHLLQDPGEMRNDDPKASFCRPAGE